MKVTEVNIELIKPYWRNPRNNDKAVEAVKQSITDYGMNQPLVLDKENVIIAGHTRYKACLQLGMKKVPCVVLSDITQAKAKEYRIADNKTSELAEWDMEQLIPELREIEGIGDFQVYFPNLVLEDLLQETAGANNTFTPATAETIAQIQNKMETAHEGKATDYIEVMCPHCGEQLYLARDNLMKQPAVTME